MAIYSATDTVRTDLVFLEGEILSLIPYHKQFRRDVRPPEHQYATLVAPFAEFLTKEWARKTPLPTTLHL